MYSCAARCCGLSLSASLYAANAAFRLPDLRWANPSQFCTSAFFGSAAAAFESNSTARFQSLASTAFLPSIALGSVLSVESSAPILAQLDSGQASARHISMAPIDRLQRFMVFLQYSRYFSVDSSTEESAGLELCRQCLVVYRSVARRCIREDVFTVHGALSETYILGDYGLAQRPAVRALQTPIDIVRQPAPAV